MIKIYTDEELPQGSNEWLSLRKEYGTASEAAAALEVSPWIPKSRLQLWELKNGELEIKDNFAMKIGRDHEDEAMSWFSSEIGKAFEPCCIVDDETYSLPLMASLDGRQVFGGTEIAEIKCPLNGGCSELWSLLENNEELPIQYQLQMTQQMMLSGEKFSWFVVYDWKGKRGRYTKFYLNEELVSDILGAWKEYFKGKPEAGPKDIVKRDDVEWKEAASNWRIVKDMADKYTKDLKEARQKMIDICDNQSFQGSGVRCRLNHNNGTWTVGKVK